MKIHRTVRTALLALRRNPMRAMLTTLGIVIGVAAVIAMMEIGNGSSSAIKKSIASMGANTILVHPGTAASGGISFGAGSVMTLTPQDYEAIVRECPSVRQRRSGGSCTNPGGLRQPELGAFVDRRHNAVIISKCATGPIWRRAKSSATGMS